MADPTSLTMDNRSHKLDYGQSHKHSVADSVLKRGGTPILFALLELTAKNSSEALISRSINQQHRLIFVIIFMVPNSKQQQQSQQQQQQQWINQRQWQQHQQWTLIAAAEAVSFD